MYFGVGLGSVLVGFANFNCFGFACDSAVFGYELL